MAPAPPPGDERRRHRGAAVAPLVAGALAAGWITLSTACGALGSTTQLDDVACPPDSTLTYDSFGRDFVDSNCEPCHAAGAVNRHGAPEDYTFDNLGEVQRHRERIFANAAADNSAMPPGPDHLPQEQRDQLAEWLACGAP